VAGKKFRALPFIVDKANTLRGTCSHWGYLEFRRQKGALPCSICTGPHPMEAYKCRVATCGRIGKDYPHTVMKCPNCGSSHPAQHASCKAKCIAIAIAQGGWPAAQPRPYA